MDEIRKIVLMAGIGITGAVAGYSYGYLTLLQYYLVQGGVITIIGIWTIWNLFIRKAFSLHFQNEEGNQLREVAYVRIVPFDKDKSTYNYKKAGTEREFWIDSRNTVYTDRYNKSHLFFPINNVFAFHPFAKTYSLKDNGEIPDEFKTYLEPNETPKDKDIHIPSEVLSPEQEKKREDDMKAEAEAKKKLPIGAIPIEFFTLMRVSAVEFAQMFSGKQMMLRIEAMRNKAKRDKNDIILGVVLGLMIGLLVGIVGLPAYQTYSASNHINTNPNNIPIGNNSDNSTYTLPPTRTNITTQQTNQIIPSESTLIGESSMTSGNTTIQYYTYAHGNTTVTITHTTTATSTTTR